MSAVNKLIKRFTKYIETIKSNESSYVTNPLYPQILQSIADSTININNLHKVRDLINEIQKTLDNENNLLLNFHLMMLFSALASQHQSKEFLYFAALFCNNVISVYYFLHEHEITSIDVRHKCEEMIVILLSPVVGIEVLKTAREIYINQTSK
jgi:hypothetical protein